LRTRNCPDAGFGIGVSTSEVVQASHAGGAAFNDLTIGGWLARSPGAGMNDARAIARAHAGGGRP
jgi:hypothetical protein